MQIDKDLEYSDKQAIYADGDATNVVDLGHSGKWGVGRPIYLIIEVTEAYNQPSTLVAQHTKYLTAARGTPSDLTARMTFSAAEMRVAGSRKTLALDVGDDFRYSGLKITMGGTTSTAGSISARLSNHTEGENIVPSGQVIN